MYPTPSGSSSSPIQEYTVYWKTESIIPTRGAGTRRPHPPPLPAPAPATPLSKRSTTTAKLPSPSSLTGTGVKSARRCKKRRAELVGSGGSQEKVDEGTMRTLGAIALRLNKRESSGPLLSATPSAIKEGLKENAKGMSIKVVPSVKGKEKAVVPPISKPPTPLSVPRLPSALPTSKTTLSVSASKSPKQPKREEPTPKEEEEEEDYFATNEESFELALSQLDPQLCSSQPKSKSISPPRPQPPQTNPNPKNKAPKIDPKSKEEKAALVRKEMEILEGLDVGGWSDDDF